MKTAREQLGQQVHHVRLTSCLRVLHECFEVHNSPYHTFLLCQGSLIKKVLLTVAHRQVVELCQGIDDRTLEEPSPQISQLALPSQSEPP